MLICRASSLAHASVRHNKVFMRPKLPLKTSTNLVANDVSTINISEFYKGANVFITGGTGFLGKTLLEKLLRSCVGIESIYVLIRPKRGVEVDERLEKTLKSPVFNRIRENSPHYFDKIKAVSGDLEQAHLGLSEFDRSILAEKVNVVFHSAADVRFNDDLKTLIVLNTFGTKSLIELCKEIKQLKSFVHVSTAYCHPDKKNVEEIVYDPPYDPNAMINCVETLPSDAIVHITKTIIDKYPNTYTFAKELAEHLVLECSHDIPAAIVRPSIVTAAWQEPFPGWVDSLTSATGIMCECARGTVKSAVGNPLLTADFIPVDIVANTLITASWYTVAYRPSTLKVYNCTSGQINAISWGTIREMVNKYAVEYPSKYLCCYPKFSLRSSRKTHLIFAVAFHHLPAYIRDVVAYMTRRRVINVRICRQITRAAKNYEFFTLREWNFDTSNFRQLMEAVNNANDGKNFNIDLSERNGFQWDSYMKDYILGIRQYVLKDDLSSLSKAKTTLNMFYWTNKGMQVIFLGTVFGLIIMWWREIHMAL